MALLRELYNGIGCPRGRMLARTIAHKKKHVTRPLTAQEIYSTTSPTRSLP